jgi:hypothetical protein|tara:strand:+ start:1614 stop:2084 length:471 start_codon:yes stop_codon:yes gene_type:complete
MPDTNKFKKRIRAGRVPGVAGPAWGMPKETERVEDDAPKYHRYGSKSVDDEGNLKPVAGLYHTFIYDQKGKPKPTGKGPTQKGDKPLYGYKGTDNPVAKKKKPKKIFKNKRVSKAFGVDLSGPTRLQGKKKVKKRIKGTLRDNLPIFGGHGQVPEG